MTEFGGILWLVIDVLFVVVLGGAIIYAIYQWRRRPRNAATRDVAEDAVRKEYHRENKEAE
jgi:hypothetical protein